MRADSTRKLLLCSRLQDWKPFVQLWGLKTLWVTPRSAVGSRQEQRGHGRTLPWAQHLPGRFSCPMESLDIPFTELSLPRSSAEVEQQCFTWKIHPESRENCSAPCASRQDTPKPAAFLTPQPEEEWRGSADRLVQGDPGSSLAPQNYKLMANHLWDSCLKEH